MFSEQLKQVVNTDGARYLEEERRKRESDARKYYEDIKPDMISLSKRGVSRYVIPISFLNYPKYSDVQYIVELLKKDGFAVREQRDICPEIEIEW